MKDEFNEIVSTPKPTNTQPNEFSEAKEYQIPDEFNVGATNSSGTSKKSNKLMDTINNIIKAMTYTAATGTVAVVATLFILNMDILNERPNVEFEMVEVGENEIFYHIDIGESTEDLTIKLYNDNYEYEVIGYSGFNSGEFMELEAETSYKLAVCGEERYGNDVIKEIEVKTKKQHDVIVTDIGDIKVSYECKCNIDGCFHIKLDFIDTEYTYYEFKAYLSDDKGNEIEYFFLDGYTTEQRIDISEADFTNKEHIHLVITCIYNGEVYSLLDTYVSI